MILRIMFRKPASLPERMPALHSLGQSEPVGEYINIITGEGIRSVIPQRIMKGSASPSITFEMRLSKDFPDKIAVEMLEDNRIIKTIKRNYGRPAEMISLKIDGSELTSLRHEGTRELLMRITEL